MTSSLKWGHKNYISFLPNLFVWCFLFNQNVPIICLRYTNDCKQTYLQMDDMDKHSHLLTHAEGLDFSHASIQQANKHTDEALQAENPFITSCCGWGGRSGPPSAPLSVHKPLKPCPTPNERPLQSVSNPVPIWASLPWASFAFVLWLSKGQALHFPT